ncbi:putative transcriptional regulator [Bradyrhizobium sp. USDA 3311]
MEPALPRFEHLVVRAKAIGLTPSEWASAAGVARSTVFHLTRGTGPRGPHIGTLGTLADALQRREMELLRHLIDLHGVPEEQAA